MEQIVDKFEQYEGIQEIITIRDRTIMLLFVIGDDEMLLVNASEDAQKHYKCKAASYMNKVLNMDL